MAAELENMITIREAAKECHRTSETIRRWVWEGKLPAQKLGNQLFVRKADLARCGCGGKDAERGNRMAVLESIKANRERVRQRLGKDIDVLEALDRSREAHP